MTLPRVLPLPAGPPPPRPGELARAQAKHAHAARGHRELEKWHREQIAPAPTAPATPKAKAKAGDEAPDAPAILSAAEMVPHEQMANTHAEAAAKFEAEAEKIAQQLAKLQSHRS